MLFSLYLTLATAEGKFHLFTCIKNGNKNVSLQYGPAVTANGM
jgi:hypothetical protein